MGNDIEMQNNRPTEENVKNDCTMSGSIKVKQSFHSGFLLVL